MFWSVAQSSWFHLQTWIKVNIIFREDSSQQVELCLLNVSIYAGDFTKDLCLNLETNTNNYLNI